MDITEFYVVYRNKLFPRHVLWTVVVLTAYVIFQCIMFAIYEPGFYHMPAMGVFVVGFGLTYEIGLNLLVFRTIAKLPTFAAVNALYKADSVARGQMIQVFEAQRKGGEAVRPITDSQHRYLLLVSLIGGVATFYLLMNLFG